jgi:transcriptional regulator with XRE-family HTH domain
MPNTRQIVAELDTTFGSRVREVRERLGMPQTHISTTMRMAHGFPWHQNTTGKVESGERPIKLAEAVAVAAILGVPLEDLIGVQTGTGTTAAKRAAKGELVRLALYVEQRQRELEGSP